ncbi:GATA transcription factor 6-like [Phalaenopsis equestris]|uniref:GATA transcription factor 6-like n=1 Tax=Phalaenopsis equestris TaxID=78828 RepID=UPI0009E552C6|nr:GATA transcription factor 6-like [Phalaenopsis equestris]
MLHQTLGSFQPFSASFSYLSTLPSASFYGGSSSSSIPLYAGRLLSPSPPHTRASQVEMKLMKDMLSSAREQGFPAGDIEEVAWLGERDNLLGEDFQVDDLLDLRGLPESEEDEEAPKVTEAPNHKHSFSPLKTFPCADSENNERLELYSEITLHETDAASLEWLSTFFDDCAKEFPSSPPSLPAQNHMSKCYSTGSLPAPSLFSTATAAGSLSTESLVPIKAKRSKRLRKSRALWSLSGSLKLADSSPSSSLTTFTSCSPTPSSSSSSSSFNSYFHDLSPFTGFTMDGSLALSKAQKLKKRGRKPKNPFFSPAERRCTHCGVHKTPQWRAGPQGAKTLCNACGVRYKSGRLLPEYRPACSPSFVSNIHSNSHRKVLEMRRKKDEQLVVISAPPVSSC